MITGKQLILAIEKAIAAEGGKDFPVFISMMPGVAAPLLTFSRAEVDSTDRELRKGESVFCMSSVPIDAPMIDYKKKLN